jgi:hypothetical protein
MRVYRLFENSLLRVEAMKEHRGSEKRATQQAAKVKRGGINKRKET